jgi:hypothetical protein
MNEDFEIIGRIEEVEVIAVGGSIREIQRLRKAFGRGRWRKLKGKRSLDSKMVQFILSNCIGMRLTALAGRS